MITSGDLKNPYFFLPNRENSAVFRCAKIKSTGKYLIEAYNIDKDRWYPQPDTYAPEYGNWCSGTTFDRISGDYVKNLKFIKELAE